MEPYLALNIAEVLQMSLDDVGIEDWGIFSASFRCVRAFASPTSAPRMHCLCFGQSCSQKLLDGLACSLYLQPFMSSFITDVRIGTCLRPCIYKDCVELQIWLWPPSSLAYLLVKIVVKRGLLNLLWNQMFSHYEALLWLLKSSLALS